MYIHGAIKEQQQNVKNLNSSKKCFPITNKMNKTITHLIISQHFINSPLLSTGFAKDLKMQKVSFNKFLSPFTFGRFHSFYLSDFAFSHGLSAAIKLEGKTYTTVASFTEGDHILDSGRFNDITSANQDPLVKVDVTGDFTVSKCEMVHCGTNSILLAKSQSILVKSIGLTNCYSFDNSAPAFDIYDTNKEAQFEVISIKNYYTEKQDHISGEPYQASNQIFKFVNVPTVVLNNVSVLASNQREDEITIGSFENVQFLDSRHLIFQSNATQSLSFKNTFQGFVYRSSFAGLIGTANFTVEDSNVVLRECCFQNLVNESDPELIIDSQTNINNAYFVDRYNRHLCPTEPALFKMTEEPEEDLTTSEKAYSIATFVWFIIFFVALFVALLSFIFCKRGDPTDEYIKPIEMSEDVQTDEEDNASQSGNHSQKSTEDQQELI